MSETAVQDLRFMDIVSCLIQEPIARRFVIFYWLVFLQVNIHFAENFVNICMLIVKGLEHQFRHFPFSRFAVFVSHTKCIDVYMNWE